MVKVRLYRPFSMSSTSWHALPKTVKADRGPGSHQGAGQRLASPCTMDVITALAEAQAAGTLGFSTLNPQGRSGGRYGLSSKEFTPAMVKAVYDELAKEAGAQEPLHRGHRGRRDSHFQPAGRLRTSIHRSGGLRQALPCSTDWARTAPSAPTRTPSRSSARRPRFFAQGYFVYDSKKAGAVTVSHLRFGPRRRFAPAYLVSQAQFMACHQWSASSRSYDMLCNTCCRGARPSC